MRPTRWTQVLVLVVLAGLVGVVLLAHDYAPLAGLSAVPPVGVGALALAEAWGAGSARARLAHRPGTRPLDAMSAARLAVLAKASTASGALVAGFYAGALGWLLERGHGVTVHHDTAVSVAGVVAGVGLLAVALWLEWVCRVPPESGGSEAAGRESQRER